MDPAQNVSVSFRIPGLHVLLVDDSRLERVATSGMLRKHGLRVTCVNDGREAVDALEHRNFDVVLMDIEMPGMDGILATVEIRQREAPLQKHTPVVALTSTEDREKCFAAGMDGFATKPLMPAHLAEILRIVTHLRSRQNTRLA